MKPIYIILLLLLFILICGSIWFKTATFKAPKTMPTPSPMPTQSAQIPSPPIPITPISSSRNQPCIQVITPAIDPKTNQCKEFPTPCEVPADWKKVSRC